MLSDLHPDLYYKVHSSTTEDVACHRGKGPAGMYGAETSDCDSPFSLINATMDWISDNLLDDIDFVIWTGDSARHDSDERKPRTNKEILKTNRIIADKFWSTFSHKVPVVPTFGNNDIYPHNILAPGPNKILRSYNDIWRHFIPEAQRHSFEFGGWFFTEVVPDHLAVFSINTMYFFDRNGAVDDCSKDSEPGYQHFEWLRIQLQFLRERGMKAIFIGHVPPARTKGKQLWDETCWQKYTLWLQQFRDVVVGSLYGHMNIDHFMLQDTHEVDFSLIEGTSRDDSIVRASMDDELTIDSSTDYLMELRQEWGDLPDPAAHKKGLEEDAKKKKKHKNIGGPFAERYQLSLIGPSIVPNYFPTIRVFDYNITGLEDSPTWIDVERANGQISRPSPTGQEELDGNRKKHGKHTKFEVPKGPSKTDPPGPAYSPQPLTWTGWTQYYANLTYINNDLTKDDDDAEGTVDPNGWSPGKHHDKTPKHKKPKPREFAFEVEYTTATDKIYKLTDLTVKSFLDLAYRIGQGPSSNSIIPDEDEEALEDEGSDEDTDEDTDEEYEDEDGEVDIEKKHKHKHKKATKLWLHFLKHAFVSTKSKKELKHL